MEASTIALGFAWYLVFLFSTTCHEAAHAWAALKGGDPTAYEGGQVSLDPVPHVVRSPFGLVLVPLLTFVTQGWMIGWASAPYDPRWAARHPLRQAAMSLAGPAANFALAIAAFLTLKGLLAAGVFAAPVQASFSRLVVVPGTDAPGAMGFVATALSLLLYQNLLLGLFNLMPVPPLDGSGVVEGVFHKQTAHVFEWLRSMPLAGLVGILVAWRLFEHIAPGIRPLLSLLHPEHAYQ